jgi:hypothetical protein
MLHSLSIDEPDQLICWNFHEMRVCPTHYTIFTCVLKSRGVESSLDGETWTVIDRQTDNDDFKYDFALASFAISNSVESRLIRLTQTDKSHGQEDCLLIHDFELCGTLLERRS